MRVQAASLTSTIIMNFKFVLASFGLMCVGVASGSSSTTCYSCFGVYNQSAEDVINCRYFVNITATDTCLTAPAYCIFYYGRDANSVAYSGRMCSPKDCDSLKATTSGGNLLHCSQCQSNYCNTDKF
ncbi:hypothetical protein PPYR_01873 [Photinus pyralis]|uniref:UPAR/Ly6 domain-containing protein n=1 Tax=Photinus pyralis TaxID=7054 RepID=A0A5N4B5T0_PHOPY|nr:uncharacterized protein LOC116175687 [Photinus pyralis]KAB0804903.1 hypothetical protein PPYR_01873 [Photinus pyralis]